MPHFTLTFSQGAPMITLAVTVSAARRDALVAAGQPIPAIQQVRGLIDTGASHTCIGPSVFQALGIQPTGSVPMLTPSTGNTPMSADTYDVSIVIPSNNPQHLPFIKQNMQVSASELLVAQGFHALVGRDILSHCVLTYNGSTNLFTLAY